MNEIEANSNWLTRENAEMKEKFYKLSNDAIVKQTFNDFSQDVM